MIERGINIVYGNYSPNAKESFEITTNEDALNTANQLKDYDFLTQDIGNPCEFCNFSLGGKVRFLPKETESVDVGLWSKQISEENGAFSSPVVLKLESDQLFSSQGMTIVFDEFKNIHATELSIIWYRDDEILNEGTFYPSSSFFVLKQQVERFNRIEIFIYSMNMPLNRIRISKIEYGFDVFFDASKIKSTKIIQEIDPLSVELAVNVCDFELKIDEEHPMLFQKKQPFYVYYNGNLLSTTFIDTYKRKSKDVWSFSTQDYIGIMEASTFNGGVYENEPANKIFDDISKSSRVIIDYDEKIRDIYLSGYIPYTNCREALMQVCFACGAVADTTKSKKVKIVFLRNEVKQKIGLERIMENPIYEQEDVFTAFELTSHKYIKTEEEVELYNGEKEGIIEGSRQVFIKFDEPVYDIVKKGPGLLLESGANYAKINAHRSTTLVGKKYKDISSVSRVENDDVLSGDLARVVKISDATLVSEQNVDNLALMCYNYYRKNFSSKMKIAERRFVERTLQKTKYGCKKYGSFKYGVNIKENLVKDEPINVGETIEYETEYLGEKKGVVVKQSFNVFNGLLVKDCIVR